MRHNQTLSVLIIGFLFLTSCKTYYISLDSFKQQFDGIDSTQLKMVEMNGGGILMVSEQYLANPITKIKCTDKKGNPAELNNSPAIEIRFTYGENNRRTVFYFDRVFVSDTVVIGMPSRFVPKMRKTIPLNEITKIEVQNGGKNFQYVNER
ncbi:MAG: hypothetical protein K9H64_13580 [Bacteroidales bacterium]|nr:hypothetical protein [Bacteroidales bacterium]MCF8457044.1 hypothetical protein [Bacteroidales bacterium]